MKTILALSPHTDDVEFGCGGFLSKYIEEGATIYIIVFSLCEQSIPRELPKDQLQKELHDSLKVFNIPKKNLYSMNIPVRNFLQYRQEILDFMIKVGQEVDPDIVLMPSLTDTHQDHNVVSQEGFRAFKGTTILGYEMPWNNLTFTSTAFCVLDKHHVKQKVRAMKKYKSQQIRPYANKDFIYSLAKTRGVQCKREYAEAFEVYRLYL